MLIQRGTLEDQDDAIVLGLCFTHLLCSTVSAKKCDSWLSSLDFSNIHRSFPDDETFSLGPLRPEASVSAIFCIVTVLDSAACSIESLKHRNFVSNPVNQASFLPRGSETWIQTAFRLSTA
jgi:hypothetical protein